MAGRSTRHPQALVALIASFVVLLLPAWSPAFAASPPAERVSSSAAEVRDYWTRARMRSAEPVELPAPAVVPGTAPSPASPSHVPAAAPGEGGRASIRASGSGDSKGPVPSGTREEVVDPSQPDVRPHGKVFFTIPAGDDAGRYVCSGTVVNSRNRSVVWTAGHCVFPEGGTDFATNWLFVPAYRDGVAPFGEWPAKRLATTGPWQTATNLNYDLGAAVVRHAPGAARLQDLVGARGIGFDQPRDQIYHAFGYPQERPPLEFTGEREFRCTDRLAGNDDADATGPPAMYIDCDMTGGASGGGWVSGGKLLSVTSYGYPADAFRLNELYGPYMSQTAKALYRGVRGKPKRKPKGGKGSNG